MKRGDRSGVTQPGEDPVLITRRGKIGGKHDFALGSLNYRAQELHRFGEIEHPAKKCVYMLAGRTAAVERQRTFGELARRDHEVSVASDRSIDFYVGT